MSCAEKFFHVTKPDWRTLGHSEPVVNPGRMRRNMLSVSGIWPAPHTFHLIMKPTCSPIELSLCCASTRQPPLQKSVTIFIIPVVTLIGYLDMSARM